VGLRPVALTGYTGIHDRIRCHEAGFRYYLLKPYDPELLRLVLAGLACAVRQELHQV
jgi:CheY-like chemotaxis protein